MQKFNWLRFVSRRYYIIYAILSILVIGYFISGYFFSLDAHFAENIEFDPSNNIMLNPIMIFMLLFSFFGLPINLLSWTLLFSIIFLSGTSMHYLLEKRLKIDSSIPKYFAGFLYAVNPFIYTRFMAGHILFLIGYAVFPFAIKAIFDFLKEKISIKQKMITSSLWLFVMGSTYMHNFLLTIFATGILFMWYFIKNSKRIELTKNVLLLGVFAILLNSYWILPSLTVQKSIIDQITEKDVILFRSIQEKGMNILTSIATLQGFWRSSAHISPTDILPTWLFYGVFFIIIYIVAYGFVSSKTNLKVPIAIIAIISFALSLGISWGPTSELFNILFEYFLPMKFFREPQKLLALLAFAYAFFGGIGVNNLLKKHNNRERDKPNRLNKNKIIKGASTLIVLILPLLFGITMFNGFWGQIKPADYPTDWYEVNQFLENDPSEFNVLFLPWHGYMNFKWLKNTDKRLGNPAKGFFDKPTIIGDNLEAGGIYSTSTNPRSKYIEFLLERGGKKELNNIGDKLSTLGIKYILLTKETDYENYNFLFNQTDLILLKETENFYVFKNKKPAYRIYGTDSILGGSKSDFEKSLKKNLSNNISPIRHNKTWFGYKLEKSEEKYFIVTEPFNEKWEAISYTIGAPIQHITVNAFENKGTAIELTFNRYYIFIIGGVISLITLFTLVVLYLKLK